MDEPFSFSYSNVFKGNDVMVFVPHEDDEINIAGAAIYGLRQEGFRVICVFATNGDRSFWQKQESMRRPLL